MLVILSGVSGAGKNTVINRLLEEGDNRFLIKSATTREPRGGGIDNNYEFMSDEEFFRREKNGEFFETIDAHAHKYATQFKELEKVISNPQNIYMKDIDVVGTQKLVSHLADKAKVLTIFLDAPDEVLYDRLIKRGESEEKANFRLSRAKMEREFKDKYDLVIENIDIEKTLEKIRKRLKKEGF